MLTPKQRAYLKGLSQSQKACFQIGKEGLSTNLRDDILHYLNKHEIIKISILKNSSTTFDEAIAYFSLSEIEFVQKIGRVLVLYKHSNTLEHPIIFP